MTFREMLARINQIPLGPLGSLGYVPLETDRALVLELLDILVERRVLYAERHLEYGPWVDQSLVELRHELKALTIRCGENSPLRDQLNLMRTACRRYLDRVQRSPLRYASYEEDAWLALGELRGVFGMCLGAICVRHGVQPQRELAHFLSLDDENSED